MKLDAKSLAAKALLDRVALAPTPPRVDDLPAGLTYTPSQYRLVKKADGTLVLQGAYMWQEGSWKTGLEWRDIPTIEEPT